MWHKRINKKILILASSSKRRSRILRDCAIRHKVIKSSAREFLGKGSNISETVKINAQLKAEQVARRVRKGVILGVDTLVLLGDNVIGKPDNRKQARSLLKKFSGRRIVVYTGLCIIDKDRNKSVSGCEKTNLMVKRIKTDEIDKYLKYLAPFDKAGGFSIEGIGSIIFDNISGSYFNVLGLPMGKLSGLLKEIGLDIFDFVQKK